MSITPYLCVDGARAAIDWYAHVFGARVSFEPIVMDDGLIGHVELDIGRGRIMMSDAFPDHGVEAPDPERGNAISLHLHTPDVDVITERAVAAGARLDRGPEDGPNGHLAVFRDPFGHRWMLNDRA